MQEDTMLIINQFGTLTSEQLISNLYARGLGTHYENGVLDAVPPDKLHLMAMAAILYRFLNLPHTQKIVVGRYLNGECPHAIARECGIKPQTAKLYIRWFFNNARKSIVKRLPKPEGFSYPSPGHLKKIFESDDTINTGGAHALP